MTGCEKTVSSDAGCRTYFELSRGMLACAPNTPRCVKEKVFVLHTGMLEACK